MTSSQVKTYLRGSLEVPRTVAVDVVVRSDGLLQLVADDHTRALRGRPSREDHDPRASVGESRLGYGISGCAGRTTISLTSSRPTATDTATPVQRNGRLPDATGHGSWARVSRMPVSWNSHCETGSKKRAAPKVCMGWPGRGAALFCELKPSMS